MTAHGNRYSHIIAVIFADHYERNIEQFEFDRFEIGETASRLHMNRPRNFGDLIYAFRFRQSPPESITRTAPAGRVPAGHPLGT